MAHLPAQARVLFAVIGALTWLGSSLAPAHASPTLALSLNQTTVRPGDTLHVGLTARNPGEAFNADFYFGILVPDGVTVVFLTSLSPLNGVWSRLDASPTTFQPLLANLLIPAGLDVTLTDVLSLTFSQGFSPGTYVFFVALTPPRAFSDGRIDAGDILAIDAQALSFSLATPVGPSFPIATTPLPETSFSAAFDGTNFLVGMASTGGINAPGIGAQLVSPSGTVVGPPIFTGRFGGEPIVTFDGTNYLLVWGDTAPGNTGVFGQFVSPSGTFVGSPFTLSQAVPRFESLGGAVAFDGTNYFVIWTDARRSTGPDEGPWDIFGQRVSKQGALVGGEIKVSGARDGAVAFDGINYLVVWNEDVKNTDINGRFVSPSGTLGPEFVVNANAFPSDNPLAVAFDGTNYLVVWSDEGRNVPGEWDLFGQLVTPSGVLSGGVISVTTAPGHQIIPFIAFDGTNYLVTWTDVNANRTNANINGRFIGKSGALVGAEFPITTDAFASPVVFGGGKYFVVWNSGVTNADVFGAFIVPAKAP